MNYNYIVGNDEQIVLNINDYESIIQCIFNLL